MVLEWGMGQRLYYEPQKADAEIEINRLLENADREALAIILAQKEKTALLAKALLARETLTKEEVLALFEKQTVRGFLPHCANTASTNPCGSSQNARMALK